MTPGLSHHDIVFAQVNAKHEITTQVSRTILLYVHEGYPLKTQTA